MLTRANLPRRVSLFNRGSTRLRGARPTHGVGMGVRLAVGLPPLEAVEAGDVQDDAAVAHLDGDAGQVGGGGRRVGALLAVAEEVTVPRPPGAVAGVHERACLVAEGAVGAVLEEASVA